MAVLGRRLIVGRTYHRFELPFSIADIEPEFDWERRPAEDQAQHLLVFEFAQPFAVAIRAVSVVVRASAGMAGPGRSAPGLEDRNIAAQADGVTGLAAWLGMDLRRVDLGRVGESGCSPLNWRWSASRGSVEVVVCVHDAIDDTLACLASMVGATEVPHTVRIFDDGSSPTNAARLRDFVRARPWMSVTRSEENRGYTWSADTGVRGSQADWVVLLNSDTLVTRGWLDRMLDCALSDPAIAFVGPLSNAGSFQSVPELHDARGKWNTNPLPAGWTAQDVADVVAEASVRAYPDVPLLNGFCTLMKRSVFVEIGGLNHQAFPTGYGEENDLCLRARKAGYRLVVADDVYVYHVKSASFGTGRRTALSKQGTAALKALHPDADLPALTGQFRDTPPLVAMRAAVRDAYGAAL